MPPKNDQYSTPSQKILNLFSILLFTGRKYSLSQLSTNLGCSKQTILRMTDELSRTHGVKLKDWMENGQKWFQIESSARPHVSFSPREIQLLGMCKELVWHLLPKGIRAEVEETLNKSTAFLPEMAKRDNALDSICEVSVKGAIDYTPFQEFIERFFEAIKNKMVCEVIYKAPYRYEARVYHFAPVKILSYRESLYISGYQVTEKGKPEIVHEMILAIHRMQGLSVLGRVFDFECDSNSSIKKEKLFGFMEDEALQVAIKFRPDVVQYVRERKWSDQQTIKEYKDGSILLEFSAQSELEVISWVLSFGKQAVLIKPKDLKQKIVQEVSNMMDSYKLKDRKNKD